MPSASKTIPALAFRTLALIILVSQFFLYISELSNYPFFVSSILVMTGAGIFLGKRAVRFFPALAVSFLAPFLVRGAFFLLFSLNSRSSNSPGADSLFFLFDLGFYPSLVPAIWASVSIYACLRNPKFIIWEPFANAAVLAACFWNQAGYRLSLYSHPSVFALSIGLFLLCEVFALYFASEAEYGNRPAKRAGSPSRGGLSLLLVLIPLLVVLLLYMLGAYSEGATTKGGGLIKPTLFRFDFSKYLKLESEISLSDELVLLVRRDRDDSNILLRRYVLNGYDSAKGFFYEEIPGIFDPPRELPSRAKAFPDPSYGARHEITQEYYFVNFDPGSFIAMNYPIEVVPYRVGPDSNFQGAYKTSSKCSDGQLSIFLSDTPSPENYPPGEMDKKKLEYFTRWGKDEKVRELALETTGDLADTYGRVMAIYEYLKYGYFYSLKPGIAPDGDQLGHFLFASRKGYCSYFAFSMALMLRSIGIPARVSVGFFIDPESQVLDIYPVRANMAHAWVEVYFPGYGWIEFDPTSETPAEGENFELSSGLDLDILTKLVGEILTGMKGLEEAGEASPAREPMTLRRLAAETIGFFARYWYLVIPAFYLACLAVSWLSLFLPLAFSGNPRGRGLARFAFTYARIVSLGRSRHADESLSEFAERIYREGRGDLRASVALYQRALYAQGFGKDDEIEAKAANRSAYDSAAKTTGFWRRAISPLVFPKRGRP